MTQFKILAACLLAVTVEGGRDTVDSMAIEVDSSSIRKRHVLQQGIEVASKTTMNSTLGFINFGTDKICCCEDLAQQTQAGSDQNCYWQDRVPLDITKRNIAGAGCNWLSLFNPWANRKHISGIVNSRQDKMITFSTQEYGSQCSGDRAACAAKEAEYAAQCTSAHGNIVAIRGADGTHQYVQSTPTYEQGGENKEYFPAAAPPDVYKKPTAPEVFAEPEFAVEVIRKAEQDIAQSAKRAEVVLTSKLLKKFMRAKNDVLCSDACDMWPPRKGTQTGKKGCHSPLDPSKYKSNAVNYCKNTCSPDNGCRSTTSITDVFPDLPPEVIEAAPPPDTGPAPAPPAQASVMEPVPDSAAEPVTGSAAQADSSDESIETAQPQPTITLTNSMLKKAEREKPPNTGWCAVACVQWTIVGRQTPRDGCASKRSMSDMSNAGKYCKNACSPENCPENE